MPNLSCLPTADLCDLCATNSGRTNANRACCRLRELAQSPRHQQAAYARQLTWEQREELRPRLAAEIARLKKLKGNS